VAFSTLPPACQQAKVVGVAVEVGYGDGVIVAVRLGGCTVEVASVAIGRDDLVMILVAVTGKGAIMLPDP
jgi:hypothetical protein